MSKSPNYITLEKYIELMNNFVEVKTELVCKKDEILESRIENYKNYINLQKEKDAAILEERARFDEMLLKTSEHLENKINERIENLEKKVGNMYNLLLDIATNINNMNGQYANITEGVEKLQKSDEEKTDKKSIDLPPVVSTQYEIREQEVFIDDFIDKVKKLNLKKHLEVKEIDKRIIYLNKYKLLIKFSVERRDIVADIYYFVYVKLSIMKGDLDEVIKWPCEEIIEVRVIGRDGERWEVGFKYDDYGDKSWRNRVREGYTEESERRVIISGTLKEYEDEILFCDKLKIVIK